MGKKKKKRQQEVVHVCNVCTRVYRQDGQGWREETEALAFERAINKVKSVFGYCPNCQVYND